MQLLYIIFVVDEEKENCSFWMKTFLEFPFSFDSPIE